MPDIEVTDEMIEAGSKALLAWGWSPDDSKVGAAAIYRAMRAKERERPPEPTQLQRTLTAVGYPGHIHSQLNSTPEEVAKARLLDPATWFFNHVGFNAITEGERLGYRLPPHDTPIPDA